MPDNRLKDVDGVLESAPIAEFIGYTECQLFSDECKITLDKDGLNIFGIFQQFSVLYGEIHSIESTDYRLQLKTTNGNVTFSRMGQELNWLKDKLLGAFNDAVAAIFGVKGKVILETACEYAASENDCSHHGPAMIRLYDDCLCILPPNENARRLPLCWFSGMDQTGYSLELSLACGEKYILSKMGHNLDELQRQLTVKLRTLRENTYAWHKDLAPSLSSMQAAASGSLMPLGRAADFGKLQTMAPPLAEALESKLSKSRIGTSLPWIMDISGDTDLMLGALPVPDVKSENPISAVMPQLITQNAVQQSISEDENSDYATPVQPPPILWLIVPDREQYIAAVELALPDNETAATYLYRIEGRWKDFSLLVDRAIEAAGFQREVILLSDEKLSSHEHISKSMLLRRTPSLKILRNCFVGRAIHSSQERWKKDIEKCLKEAKNHKEKTLQTKNKAPKFCLQCGKKLAPGIKFCRQCGTKIY